MTGEPLALEVDPARLEQVLTNLLTNAFKYGAGKPVRVATESEGGTARLIVSDQGLGRTASVPDTDFSVVLR